MLRASRLGLSATLFALVAACGGSDSTGPAGPAGPPGPAGAGSNVTPSGGAVFPNLSFLGRDIDVVITGDASSFDAMTTVDFGDPGVKVSNLQVVNAATIYAHLTIDPTAKVGPHDVVINQSGTMLTGKAGFKVSATMDAKITGDQLQGGVVDISLTDNDKQNQFDSLSFSLATPGFLQLGGNGASGLAADYLMAIDPTATPIASLQLEGDNVDQGTGATTRFFTATGAMKIGARAPTPLTVGTALSTDTFSGQFASHLYKVTAPSGKSGEFSLEITTGATDKTLPAALLYPSSGKGKDLVNLQVAQKAGSVSLPLGTILTGTGADFFVTVLDQDGSAGNKFSITPKLYDAGSAYAEVGTGAAAHATKATAEDLTAACVTAGVLKASCLVSGNISTDTEVDLYTVTVTAATKLNIVLTGTGPFDAGPVDPAKIMNGTDTPDLSAPSLFSAGGVEDVYVGTAPGQTASSGVTTAPLMTWIVGVAGQQGGGGPAGKYMLSIRAVP
jgi:hypothetical protein